MIIDFEGEPQRSLAERRQKTSGLRDVAGMLRSFNYARWTALRRVMHAPEDGARLAPLAATWEPQVRSAFLEAYDEAARGSGLYASFEEIQGLIQLFELEKALYELRYEINNRPGWARIPLEGILALAGLTRGEGAGAKNA
jgi:maltose alpha-D-glucosyltransferase/alpha-amylase